VHAARYDMPNVNADGSAPMCRTLWLDFPLMPFSLVQPVANICWEFKRHEDIQNAK
jgi:hypothetical protein